MAGTMGLAARAMHDPEVVDIFWWEYEARQGMARVHQSMKWICLSGINGENVRRMQVRW